MAFQHLKAIDGFDMTTDKQQDGHFIGAVTSADGEHVLLQMEEVEPRQAYVRASLTWKETDLLISKLTRLRDCLTKPT